MGHAAFIGPTCSQDVKMATDDMWMPVELSKLQIDRTHAEQCAKLAITNDGRRLCQLWKETGILYEGSPGGLAIQ